MKGTDQMFSCKTRVQQLSLALGLVGVFSATLALPAFAANGVTQQVVGGNRSASIANATLSRVNYSHAEQDNSGSLSLTADDSTGSNLGWNVTVQSSNFTNGSASIAASDFALGTPGDASADAGQAVDTTHGPSAGVGGSLDSARKVIAADAGYGKGTYSQSLPVTLTIPGDTLAGTYSATLTVSITAGPGA